MGDKAHWKTNTSFGRKEYAGGLVRFIWHAGMGSLNASKTSTETQRGFSRDLQHLGRSIGSSASSGNPCPGDEFTR